LEKNRLWGQGVKKIKKSKQCFEIASNEVATIFDQNFVKIAKVGSFLATTKALMACYE
jgi:hypothetical protein